ncbi:hypothetical protein OA169_02110 [Acidimicrobiaceae bacterium]|nr:hypothetical protein [Acidimicrobiaceae bacterium]
MSNDKNELINNLNENLVQSEKLLNDFLDELSNKEYEKDDLEALGKLMIKVKEELNKLRHKSSIEEE